MNEEKFKSFYVDYLTNSLSFIDLKELLEIYIKERKEKEVDINLQSMVTSQLTNEMAQVAIQYYINKFNIRILTKNNGERIVI